MKSRLPFGEIPGRLVEKRGMPALGFPGSLQPRHFHRPLVVQRQLCHQVLQLTVLLPATTTNILRSLDRGDQAIVRQLAPADQPYSSLTKQTSEFLAGEDGQISLAPGRIPRVVPGSNRLQLRLIET